jgi:neutral amino acid transport system permease protein
LRVKRGSYIAMTDLIQYLFNGLVAGSIFAIAAVGISLVYSVLRLVNFAAGDFLTLGAFITYYFSVTLELNFVLSILISMLAGMGISWFLELVLWRKLRRNKAGTLALFLVATGVALMLRPVIQYLFGTQVRKFNVDILKTYDFFGARIAHTQLIVLIFATASIITIALFMAKARIGKDMRAYANNPSLAAVSGINVDRVVVATWLISGALGSLAGVFQGLVQGQFNNAMGESLLLSFFAAVVLGTIGDAYGALLGGLLLGLFMELSQLGIFFGGVPSNYKPVVAFAALVLVLLFKPEGIFGYRARKV